MPFFTPSCNASGFGVSARRRKSLAASPRWLESVGRVALAVVTIPLYGFIRWLPTFRAKQGLTVATTFR